MKKLAIVGGGASGLCSAIEAKLINNALSVTVFDRMPKVAKKLLATGNGRCNFANEDLSIKHFYGDNQLLKAVLSSPFSDSEGFFRECGVLTYHESGRIYPRSQQASTIRDALINRCEFLGVNFVTDKNIEKVVKSENGFLVDGENFDCVIISGGGKASQAQGSNGSCYQILNNLGHSFTKLYPALTGFTTNDKDLNELKGVRCKCNAMLFKSNKLLGKEIGEVQFTDKCISGIPIMNLSHFAESRTDLKFILDLCEELCEDELFEHIKTQRSKYPNLNIEALLSGLINSKVAKVCVKKSGFKKNMSLKELTNRDIDLLINLLKSFQVKVSGTRSFDNAQITCGGLNSNEINPQNMMSKKIDGLFICGEILNIHGDCGGYNLHLAWTTGRIAGYSAAEYLG